MSDLRVRAAVERFRREVRREALEEAAKIAEQNDMAFAEEIAAAIRNLMEKKDE